MRSRYLFNATPGSVVVSPYDYVLEARAGSLRLIQPTAAVYAIMLAMFLAVVFGALALFAVVGNTSLYQDARPWENPPLFGTILLLFLAGFLGALYLTERWGQRLAVRAATRLTTQANQARIRDYRPGKLIQKVVVQTDDNRVLPMEIEAAESRFRAALELAGATLPVTPITEEEVLELDRERGRFLRTAPAPRGPGRFNTWAFVFVVGFLVVFDALAVWLFLTGASILALVSMAIFFPFTISVGLQLARVRRYHCYVCGRLTVFRREGDRLTCGRCGGSWQAAGVGP